MSSLLPSTGSSPYILVHIVGPLATTIQCGVNEMAVIKACTSLRGFETKLSIFEIVTQLF